ncbi:MAG: response regulator [Chitinispirillia bacterium]|nr:response regulator [Chitinispirillia bacterium]MCL2242406.1 response regulator [Chitinispirillia bacterium]
MEGARKRIIYVDDVNFDLLLVRDRLKAHYAIFPAQSVMVMFDILGHVKPDLILLDVKMPGVNGYEAIKMLRANELYAKIPVIFLTSQNDKDSVLKSISLGAAAYVIKPFAVEALIETIEGILNPGKRKGADEDDPRPRILAIDDVPSMLRTIHYTLRDKYRVYTLPKPEALKSYLNEITPDLFLLDYKMPGMSGLDLIPIIRDFPEHRDTPIIFLTSERGSDIPTTASCMGACDYIMKPFDPKVLLETIDRHLNMT